jgi:crotonobetainyl-CoA:carnitine CoA-transferase CaiB-like acyl-CoA transferase
MSMAPGPLSGFGWSGLRRYYTGPMIAAILGDQGADVIKVEASGGDEPQWRRAPYPLGTSSTRLANMSGILGLVFS